LPEKEKGFHIWGSEPDWDQLEQGELLKSRQEKLCYFTSWKGVGTKILKAGIDYDEIVLGISIGGFPYMCKELIQSNSKWKNMVDHLPTFQTIAYQMWFNKPLVELGFEFGISPPNKTIGARKQDNFEDFADFTDLIPVEGWGTKQKPVGLLYLCGPSRDCMPPPIDEYNTEYRRLSEKSLDDKIRGFFETTGAPVLFPSAIKAPSETAFNLDYLYASNREQAIEEQFRLTNIDPSERYVLSLPGTACYRLHAWGSEFSNLTLCGDWIYTGMNVGSIESSVLSGALASFALTGRPLLEDIQGYLFLHQDQKSKGKNVHHPLA